MKGLIIAISVAFAVIRFFITSHATSPAGTYEAMANFIVGMLGGAVILKPNLKDWLVFLSAMAFVTSRFFILPYDLGLVGVYEACAHLFVGGLLGAFASSFKLKSPKSRNCSLLIPTEDMVPFTASYWLLGVLCSLTFIEVVAFLLNKA